MLQKIKNLIKKNNFLFLIALGLRYLFIHGPKATLLKVCSRHRLLKNRYMVSKKELNRQKKYIFSRDIKISIITPLYNTPQRFLKEMIDSVIAQTYSNWELCLADGSDNNSVMEFCGKYKDKRVKYVRLDKNLGIVGNSNAAFELATGEYIALLDHDDVLHPSALFFVMNEICKKKAEFIYSDELTFRGKISTVVNMHFKPDYAPDNLRSNNYICHLSVFKKELLNNKPPFQEGFDGSQDHDLILRLTENLSPKKISHIPRILYFWRASKDSTAGNSDAKPYTVTSGIKAVSAHLERMGLDGKVESIRNLPIYRVKYTIKRNPKISIIIPNKDNIDTLDTCLKSIEKSSYKNYEIIIVENNSKKQHTFDYYKKLKNIRVLTYKGKFNYSKINNFAAARADGEYLLFLNNDTEVINKDWIEEMLMLLKRDNVGAVGAKLYYPNNTIQHGGVILGVGGVANHAFLHCKSDDSGYFGRLLYQQNYSVVTGACMMTKKSIFDGVGGFEEKLAVAFNDVDLCMKIRKKGYLVTWTPFAELYHYESLSRGFEDTPEKQARFNSEVVFFQKKWQKELKNGDPYYNPNFNLGLLPFTG